MASPKRDSPAGKLLQIEFPWSVNSTTHPSQVTSTTEESGHPVKLCAEFTAWTSQSCPRVPASSKSNPAPEPRLSGGAKKMAQHFAGPS